jgi:hypothetical protein
VSAFVTTNSICQGQQVPILWPLIFESGHEIAFAHTSFKWANLASHNAGVTVAIVAISNSPKVSRVIYSEGDDGDSIAKETPTINAYLVSAANVFVNKVSLPISAQPKMTYGNKPVDGGHLLMEAHEIPRNVDEVAKRFIRPIAGSHDFINGNHRFCIWICDSDREAAEAVPFIGDRISANRSNRLASRDKGAQDMAQRAHQFRDTVEASQWSFIVPRHSSVTREYLPVGILPNEFIINDSAFALYDAELWNISIVASRLHLVWIATVCGKIKTDYRYSNTLGWNTFPVPKLTEKNKADLTRCAEDILLAREAHFPATIADLYDPEKMPANLRAAHDHNDEVLERIYIGRRFRNDTERLEKLFEMYTRMTTKVPQQ